MIYLLKANEKTNDYRLKVTYNLNEIKSLRQIDQTLKQQLLNGNTVETKVYAFEMEFENDNGELIKFVWQCEKVEHRNEFLDTLWKLSEQFLKKNERPKFVNYEFKDAKANQEANAGDNVDSANSSLLVSQNFEISKSDEESLLKLMAECDFQSSLAENFVQRLQNELTLLDAVRI